MGGLAAPRTSRLCEGAAAIITVSWLVLRSPPRCRRRHRFLVGSHPPTAPSELSSSSFFVGQCLGGPRGSPDPPAHARGLPPPRAPRPRPPAGCVTPATGGRFTNLELEPRTIPGTFVLGKMHKIARRNDWNRSQGLRWPMNINFLRNVIFFQTNLSETKSRFSVQFYAFCPEQKFLGWSWARVPDG